MIGDWLVELLMPLGFVVINWIACLLWAAAAEGAGEGDCGSTRTMWCQLERVCSRCLRYLWLWKGHGNVTFMCLGHWAPWQCEHCHNAFGHFAHTLRAGGSSGQALRMHLQFRQYSLVTSGQQLVQKSLWYMNPPCGKGHIKDKLLFTEKRSLFGDRGLPLKNMSNDDMADVQ